MKRKPILTVASILLALLATLSLIALSQAQPKSEFVTYDLKQIPAPGETISTDTSNYPIVKSESTDTMVEGTITIGDNMYTYPDDFEYESRIYSEINVETGEGTARLEKTFTFNLPGNPKLKSWLVITMTGLIQPVNPENIHTQGEFKLTGTKQFSLVEGFGLENNGHHFGFIKGWKP